MDHSLARRCAESALAEGQNLTQNEIAARNDNGVPPYHVLDWDHFPFAYSDLGKFENATAAWLDIDPDNPNAFFHRALARQARKDYAGANAYLEEFHRRAPAKPKSFIRLGGAERSSQTVELAPVSGAYPKGPALFLCCDVEYFNVMAMPLLRSISEKSPDIHVHVHIMTDRESVKLSPPRELNISFSAENASDIIRNYGIDPDIYYGTMRFVRFAEALRSASESLCMLDVDALALRDLRPLFNISSSIAMRVRPGRIEPWHQFSACMIRAHPSAYPYFHHVSEIIKASMSRLWWGFDQYALFSAWIDQRPQIQLLGPDFVDVGEHDAEAMVWMTAGKKKRTLLIDQTPYALMFQRYFSGQEQG